MPSSGGLPNPGIEPRSTTLQANSLSSEPPGKPQLADHYDGLKRVSLNSQVAALTPSTSECGWIWRYELLERDDKLKCSCEGGLVSL